MSTQIQTLEITWSSIGRVISAIVALWLIWRISDVLVLLFIVIVLVTALSPVVDRWSKIMPRAISILIIFLIILAGLTGMIGLLVPPLIVEIQSLAESLPVILTRVTPFIENGQSLVFQNSQAISRTLSQLGQSLVSTTFGIAGSVAGTITITALTFYLLAQKSGGINFLTTHLPLENRDQIAKIAQKIGLKMGAWLRGQVIITLITGTVIFISLFVTGVPYAVTLAVWSGVLEFIPYIGPVIGMITTLIVAFALNPIAGLILLVVYLALQQVQAAFLVPKIVGKAVGLSPVTVIIALLVGGKISGTLGVILAVPAAVVISVVVQEWPSLSRALQKTN